MDKSLMLNMLKKHLNIKTDKDFAEFLEIKATTLSMWHKRNVFDTELIFKKFEFINPKWLLTGEGEMLKQDEPVKQNIDCEKAVKNLEYTIEVQKKLISKLEEENNSLKSDL